MTLNVLKEGSHAGLLCLLHRQCWPHGKDGEYWSDVTVEVKPPTVQKAFMDCSNMVLSAKKGNLVLDMTCGVYFTNPTNVSWKVTHVDMDAYILKNHYAKELTPEFTEDVLTNEVPSKGTGRITLEFHDTLSTSGVLGKGIKLLELDGVTVPVQANFTVLVNNKPVVLDSHGREWYLDYTVHTDVTIVVDGGKVAEDMTTDLIANGGDAIAGAIVGSAIPVVGTAGDL